MSDREMSSSENRAWTPFRTGFALGLMLGIWGTMCLGGALWVVLT